MSIRTFDFAQMRGGGKPQLYDIFVADLSFFPRSVFMIGSDPIHLGSVTGPA